MIEAQPSRTALRVALRRAAHQVHDARPLVLDDPLAVKILGPEFTEEIKRTPSAEKRPFSAALRAFMVCRARFAEDVLADAMREDNVRQYVVLGAGLDTFAYRNKFAEVKVFEVDHPATQAWKRERLQAAGIAVPETMQFVAVDFETMSLERELLSAGFDFSAPAVVAWLGVVPYLSAEGFAATMRVLEKFSAGSSVVFDYSQPREVLSPNEQLMLDSISARVAMAGEPFQLFFTPEQLAKEMEVYGWRVAEDLDGKGLNARYLAERKDGLQLRGSAGRLCHAKTE